MADLTFSKTEKISNLALKKNTGKRSFALKTIRFKMIIKKHSLRTKEIALLLTILLLIKLRCLILPAIGSIGTIYNKISKKHQHAGVAQNDCDHNGFKDQKEYKSPKQPEN